MPTYRYRCTHCDEEYEVWQSMSASPMTVHGDVCAGLVERVLGPVRTHGIGTAGAKTRVVDRTEKTWDKDRPAYRRLRHNGMQPPHVDGCAELESRAKTSLDVNTGLRYGHIPDGVKERVQEANESGWVPRKAGV